MAKRKKENLKSSKNKMLFVMVLFALLWTGLLGRAAWLQLYKGADLSRLALRQHLAAELERGERGSIFDRNGNLLATSVEASSLYIRPVNVKDVGRTVTKLSKILGISRSKLKKSLSKKSNFIWIKRQLDDRAANKIKKAKLPGVYLTTEFVRLYPYNHLAGQLLGFAGIDGKGLEGLEKEFNDRLAGRKAQFVVQRDASGRRLYLDEMGREVDIRGKDIHLTIDSHLQSVAENTLVETIKKYDAKWGTAIVVEVATGEILALANCPRFNPNIFRTSSPKTWRNRAAIDVVEPGSTMKPFLIAAALKHGVITPEKLIDCEGGRWNLNGKYIKDTHKYGWLPAHKVLRYSSNIGSAKIGLELGAQNYHKFLIDVGFGRKTGLPLPGDRVGSIRPAADWNEIDLAAGSFGQGIGVTALQMAKAFLCVANKGIAKPLRLVQLPRSEEDEAPKRIFSADVAEKVLSMMREVVQEDGTGRRARISGTTVAGKSGTAQKAGKGGYGDQYMASFVGMVPGYNPEYIVVVLVDSPTVNHYGGTVAAPVVKTIMTEALAYYGKLPEKQNSLPVMAAKMETSSEMPKKAVRLNSTLKAVSGETVPDVKGMPIRRAVEIMVKKGFIPKLKGQGMTIIKQVPPAGDKWPEEKNAEIVLWLS
ncbi:cell division protein FtsI (penicillin-binding protein 3) [Maridesulfovibrio ferrireducens]|uniref:Cell division protein FtsI (Penicillin-binding protein 3) n=1 Tax=Maridesulfovibrio ferrireducens TaxID=246191 RepID=A0A1G9AXQ0_9BACT|nr:penicillin-binding transpeptidase domain-containing protein [Maridesulfovibrio ferrireducens]SDK31490.1 cell division protein FtsI (penicillin-binding protein 3) [Maridesulfovibrio ferrireducens]